MAFDVEKCVTEVVIDENNSSPVQGPDTPRKCLQGTIIDVTAPPPSEETQAALASAKKPGKGPLVKTREVLTARVVLKRLQDEAEERTAKKTTKVKKATKVFMKKAENDTEDLRNDENDVSDEDEILTIAMKQFAPSVTIYGEITRRIEIG